MRGASTPSLAQKSKVLAKALPSKLGDEKQGAPYSAEKDPKQSFAWVNEAMEWEKRVGTEELEDVK